MISILTPTHKKCKLWHLTVESVLQQTYKDFEWVVLDNSPDGYFEPEFERFKSEHPEYSDVFDNVKIYREVFEGTHSVGFYKNQCIKYLTCKPYEYVLILDHDDLLVRTCLEDIHGCDEKYGSKIDYITGEGVMLYNQGPNFWPKTDFSEYCTQRKKLNDLIIGKNFKLAMSNIECPQITKVDYSFFEYFIGSHPRAMRRHLFDMRAFQFYERSDIEEDTLQIIYATLYLNIGFIDRLSVIYMCYYDDDGKFQNSSFRIRNANVTISHHLIEKGKINVFESMRNFYGTDNCFTEFFHFNEFKTPTDKIELITEVPNNDDSKLEEKNG